MSRTRNCIAALSFDLSDELPHPIAAGARPAVAVLREQGVDGQTEMAACSRARESMRTMYT